MHQHYYESIIQLRPYREQIAQQLRDLCKQKDVRISKVKQLKTGWDFYVSNWRGALAITRKLQQQHGGSVNVSRSLHTEKQGKRLYRSAIIYRLPEYAKGDVIVSEGKIVLVSSAGNVIRGTDLETGKKCMVSKEDVEVLKKHRADIVKEKPRIEVLDPENYQSIVVENCTETIKKNIPIVMYQGRAYLAEQGRDKKSPHAPTNKGRDRNDDARDENTE